MPNAPKPSVLVALSSFVGELDGERLPFTKGDIIEADHPFVRAHPELFGPIVYRHPIRERAEPAGKRSG